MEKILISACLLGDNTRYDGGNNRSPYIDRLMEHYELVPFCPVVEGGLSVPRMPAERRGNYVRTETGKDVTRAYLRGAEKAIQICSYFGIKTAILKENSPACGVHQIHSGRFDGKKVPGQGVTAEFLAKKGIRLLSEDEIPGFLETLDRQQAKAESAREAKQEEMKASPKPEQETPKRDFKGKRPAKFGRKDAGKPFKKGGFKDRKAGPRGHGKPRQFKNGKK